MADIGRDSSVFLFAGRDGRTSSFPILAANEAFCRARDECFRSERGKKFLNGGLLPAFFPVNRIVLHRRDRFAAHREDPQLAGLELGLHVLPGQNGVPAAAFQERHGARGDIHSQFEFEIPEIIGVCC